MEHESPDSTMDTAKSAVFQPIDGLREIRILRLVAGHPDDPLLGKMYYTRLDDPPPYEALSYEWQSGDKTRVVLLRDDEGWDRVLPITESLYHALRDMRRKISGGPDVERLIWADAICIDQQNIQEVQDQVSIMASVYKAATRVVTYIGPETRESTLGIITARRIVRGALEGDGRSLTVDTLTNSGWKLVKDLVLRTWASRCWCAHEFLLNRNLLLMCGSVELPDWNLICAAVQLAINRTLPTALLPSGREDPYSLRECLVSLDRLRQDMLAHAPSASPALERRFELFELLSRTHVFRATDPRDKVYSILGLAWDGGRLGITVDYTIPAEKLYTDVAVRLVRTRPTMEILYHSLHVKSLTLPSWVPDWSLWHFGSLGTAITVGYNACGSTAEEVTVDYDGGGGSCRLNVAGCLVDEIVHVGEPIGRSFLGVDLHVQRRRRWVRKQYADLVEWSSESDPATVVDVLWRTIVGNITRQEEPAGKGYLAFFEAMLFYDENLGKGASRKIYDMAHEFCDAARRRSRYRRLAVTRKGFVGAVPMTAEVGDWICMFQGGPPLFAVRRAKERGCYTYLGHAYVHGLMSGEVLDADGYEKRVVTLV